MGCGIADFVRRGLKTPQTQDFWVFILAPPTKISYTTAHPITIQNMSSDQKKKIVNNPFKSSIWLFLECHSVYNVCNVNVYNVYNVNVYNVYNVKASIWMFLECHTDDPRNHDLHQTPPYPCNYQIIMPQVLTITFLVFFSVTRRSRSDVFTYCLSE